MRGFFQCLVFSSFVACLGSVHAATVTLDLRTGGRQGAQLLAIPAAKSCLQMNTLAAGATITTPLSVGDTLDFLLFENTAISVTLIDRMESPLGGNVFLGTVAGYEGIRNAVVLQTENGLTVDVQDFEKSRVYTIVSDANGVTVKEVDPSLDPVTPTTPVNPNLPEMPRNGRCTPWLPGVESISSSISFSCSSRRCSLRVRTLST